MYTTVRTHHEPPLVVEVRTDTINTHGRFSMHPTIWAQFLDKCRVALAEADAEMVRASFDEDAHG